MKKSLLLILTIAATVAALFATAAPAGAVSVNPPPRSIYLKDTVCINTDCHTVTVGFQ